MQCCPKTLILLKGILYSFGKKFLKNILLLEAGPQNFKLIWPEGKLKMLASFLSLKDNTEYICLKPTLNR